MSDFAKDNDRIDINAAAIAPENFRQYIKSCVFRSLLRLTLLLLIYYFLLIGR